MKNVKEVNEARSPKGGKGSSSTKLIGKLIGSAIVLVVAIGLFFTFFVTKIDNGNVGVVYKISGGVQDEMLAQGWHIILPTERVIEYPVRTQTVSYDGLAVATVDGKALSMPVSLNYHVDPEKASSVYKKFGNVSIEDLQAGYIQSRSQDALRQVVSQYTVIETFGEKTGEIKNGTLERLAADLENIGIIIEDVIVNPPQPDEETQKAIDERVKATQNLERTKTDKEIAKQEAERKVIEAEGEKKANEIRSKSLTPEIIQEKLIEKWDGKQPITIGGEGVIVDFKQTEE